MGEIGENHCKKVNDTRNVFCVVPVICMGMMIVLNGNPCFVSPNRGLNPYIQVVHDVEFKI